MKLFPSLVLLGLSSAPALAQGPPPVDPEIAAYQTLLNEADARIANLSKIISKLQDEAKKAKQPEAPAHE